MTFTVSDNITVYVNSNVSLRYGAEERRTDRLAPPGEDEAFP